MADIDTIVIRQFAANTNFGQLVDTVLFVIDSTSVMYNNDTASLHGNYPDNVIKYGSDWQIFLPSAHKTVSISNIESPQSQGHCNASGKVACVCFNPVQSYIQDGTTVMPGAPDVPYDGYKIFIHTP